MPLPLNRLYLSRSISEPSFGETPATLFYARQADGRWSIVRQQVDTGLAQPVTAEPPPAGGVGYGGGQYSVRGQVLVYAGRGGRLHRVDLASGEQRLISPAYEGVAAPALSPCGRFVAFLAEQDHRCNVLLVDARGEQLPVKLSSDPWYAFNPTFSPDGRQVAWMEWDEYAMPWDESRLVVARWARPTPEWERPADGLPLSARRLARADVSYSSPQFSPDGQWLAFASDETGWRGLWVTPANADDLRATAEPVDLGPGEVGGPDWVPGNIKMRWAPDGSALYALRRHSGRAHLMRAAWPAKTVSEIETGWTWMSGLAAAGDSLIMVAERPAHPPVVLTADIATGAAVPRATSAVGLTAASDLVEPRLIAWTTQGGAAVSGVLYPAQAGATGSGPRPLLVVIHGGPTSERGLSWDAEAQYFATRGWHYLLVNYRGSTGFGRKFQDQLKGQWGVVDVQDARSAAEHLVEQGLADPERLVIMGGSAGGYTTLMALTQDPGFWTAGISSYGIGQLYDLQAGSHRFELRYETTLIGPLPESGRLWKERSPLTHVSKLRAPVLLFHGRQDKAVPVKQSIDFAEAVRRQGGTAELVVYDDEGHGFTREATRRDQIETIERFLDKYVLARQ